MWYLRFLLGMLLLLFSNGTMAATVLTLDDAILLAVRTNPNVQSSRLSNTAQKFDVHVQEWGFSPQYTFQASTTYTHTGSTGQPINGATIYSVQPAVSLKTPIGTQLSLSAPVANTGNFNTGLSLQVMQPLLRGFGKPIVEAALNNAKDSEQISRLNVEGVLRTTVSSVVNAYLDVITAEKTIAIDEDALKRAEKSVAQTRLYIQAGHKAGNELVTVKANVASAKLQLINDKNNLAQTRYALLTAIGVDPEKNIAFAPVDSTTLLNRYRSLTLVDAKNQTLENDIQYQTDQITLHGSTSRALLVANDNSRWQLNASINASTGNGFTNDQQTWVNGLFNGTNRSQSVSLTLDIPINDQLAKQAIVNAKIALKQAELALKQEKWEKETSAINGWNLVTSAKRGLEFAESAEKLQEQTYQMSYQKYLHGLIDSLELQTAQTQLIQSQQALLGSQMSYIKALVNLDLLTGHTLKTWGIRTRL